MIVTMIDDKIRMKFIKIVSLYISFISKKNKFLNFIKRIKPIPQILKIFSPGYSCCLKCGLTWNHCHEKHIAVDKLSHVFVTCDYCWEHSTLDELKKIYTEKLVDFFASLYSFILKSKHLL
jgi:hypothetical protein